MFGTRARAGVNKKPLERGSGAFRETLYNLEPYPRTVMPTSKPQASRFILRNQALGCIDSTSVQFFVNKSDRLRVFVYISSCE